MVEKIYYLYADVTRCGHIFYVGKGLEQRLKELTRNKLHTNISAKYGCTRYVLWQSSNNELIVELEVAYIAAFKLNKNRHPENKFATNFTDGGDGMPGMVFSSEQLENCSRAQKLHQKQTQNRQDVVEKKRVAQIKASARPEVLEKRSKGLKLAFSNEEVKARHKAGIARGNTKPGVRERRREAAIKAQNRPEVREKKAAAQRAAYAERIAKRLAPVEFRRDEIARRLAEGESMLNISKEFDMGYCQFVNSLKRLGLKR